MRKYVLPIILAALVLVIFRSINPEIEPVGIALSLVIGAVAGISLNKFIDMVGSKRKIKDRDQE